MSKVKEFSKQTIFVAGFEETANDKKSKRALAIQFHVEFVVINHSVVITFSKAMEDDKELSGWFIHG